MNGQETDLAIAEEDVKVIVVIVVVWTKGVAKSEQK
jgi:hypothetical protein